MSAHIDASPGPETEISRRAVLFLRMALVSGDPTKREFYLSRSIAAIADAVGIETLLAAIAVGAELTHVSAPVTPTT